MTDEELKSSIMESRRTGDLQQSYDNPGWIGVGVPSVSRIIRRWITKVRESGKAAHLRTAVNASVEAAADLWTFHLRRGKNVRCPCCGWKGPGFVATSNWRAVSFNSKCPSCDSRSRHRGLVGLLPRVVDKVGGGDVLVFAPERVVVEQLSRWPALNIVTTDLYSHDVDMPAEDIQYLKMEDSTYALIVCNHVLEHVEEDELALAECCRVLRGGGVAIFTVPGDFDKRDTWIFDSPDDNGHFRHYGMDFVERLQESFEKVEAVDLAQVAETTWKVRPHDYAFVCSKAEG